MDGRGKILVAFIRDLREMYAGAKSAKELIRDIDGHLEKLQEGASVNLSLCSGAQEVPRHECGGCRRPGCPSLQPDGSMMDGPSWLWADIWRSENVWHLSVDGDYPGVEISHCPFCGIELVIWHIL